jgi:hypothetical protein
MSNFQAFIFANWLKEQGVQGNITSYLAAASVLF